MRSIHVLKELIKVDECVSEHLECLAGLAVVHQDNGDVVDMTEISQLRGEVDITRDEDDRGGGGVGVGKPTETLTKLVISSILCYGIDMYQRDLQCSGRG